MGIVWCVATSLVSIELVTVQSIQLDYGSGERVDGSCLTAPLVSPT